MDLLVMEAANLHQEQRRKEKKKRKKKREKQKRGLFSVIWGKRAKRSSRDGRLCCVSVFRLYCRLLKFY